MDSGTSEDTSLSLGVEAGFSTLEWPIAASYELLDVSHLEVEPVIYRDPATAFLRRFGPVAVAPEVERLADATDQEVLAFVREHGFLGIAGDPDATSERVLEIRAHADHLRRTRLLIRALREGAAGERLLALAREAAGHIVDARYLARVAGGSEMDDPRPGADVSLQSLHAVAVAVRNPIERLTTVTASVVKTDSGLLQIRPRLLARGPLAVAYLETLADATRIGMAWDIDAPEVRRSYPRTCQWCGRAFSGRRIDARYDSARCRWAATKAAHRAHRNRSTEEIEDA